MEIKEMRVYKDGNAWCFVLPDFENLQVSPAVFADGLPDDIDKLHSFIASQIPSGVGKGHSFKNDWDRERHHRKIPTYTGSSKLKNKQINKIVEQFGTLGSGNHFVEVCLDERDRVWIVLHSGSRGIGNELATVHIKGAKGLMKDRFIHLEDPDLAYLVEGEVSFNEYIEDMLWAQKYAMANREAMMDKVLVQFFGWVGADPSKSVGKETDRINCHHNFTQRENQKGRNLWITRKGAIKAAKGDRGIIPGSMGTKSYIVTGLGNQDSWLSCSHGAGRRLSRTAARKTLSIESLQKAMDGKSWNSTQAGTLLDEHPDSYKDIDVVMKNQKDLVRVDHTLHQILNYKGC